MSAKLYGSPLDFDELRAPEGKVRLVLVVTAGHETDSVTDSTNYYHGDFDTVEAAKGAQGDTLPGGHFAIFDETGHRA